MKKALKDYAIVLFGTGFSRGIAFINSVIIARLLGPEDFGKFSIFFIVMVLTYLFPQAFDSTFIRYAKTTSSAGEKNEFLKVSVFLKFIYSGILLLVSYPLAIFLANICFHKPETKIILVLALVSGVFQSFLMTIVTIFQEKEKFAKFSFLYASYTVAIFCMLILIKVLKLDFSLKSVIAVHVAVSIIIGSVSLFLLFRKKIQKLLPLNRGHLKTSFSLGKWIFGITVFSYLFHRFDLFFLARYANFKSVGIYYIAQQITMLISVMVGSMGGVFLPKACNSLKSRESLVIFKKESFLIISLVNSLVVVIALAAPLLIKFLYGNIYILAGSITRVLLFGLFFSIIYLPFSALYYAMDDSKTGFLLELLKFFIVTILLNVLVPINGPMGAAWAISLTLIINSIISLTVLKNKIAKYRFKESA